MSIETMKQALDALETVKHKIDSYQVNVCDDVDDAITSLRQAIAEAEQEPVACKRCGGSGVVDDGEIDCYEDGTPYANGPIKCVKDCPDCTHPQPKREPLTVWKPIETAPKDTEVLLYCNKFIPLYIGKKRYGGFGEPQQDVFAWRCSSSGRFADPTHWMPLPKLPIEAAHGIGEKK